MASAAKITPTLDSQQLLDEVWKEGTPHTIHLMVSANQVFDMDTQTATFHARLFVDAFWLPSSGERAVPEDGPRSWVAGSKAPLNLLENFEVINAGSLDKHEVVRPPELKEVNGRTMWQASIEIVGTFKQSMNLENFPLDCHSLKIHVEMGSVNCMVYKPVNHTENIMSLDISDCTLFGWIWSGVRLVFGQTDPALSKVGNTYSYFEVHFNVKREWKPFFWRIGIFNVFITLASILNFVLHPSEQFNDRLGYLVTLLLTLVAFLYTVQERLPPVGYVTLLEEDLIFSFGFIFMLFWEAGLTCYWITQHENNHQLEDADWWIAADANFAQWCAVALVARYVLYIVYCLWIRGREVVRMNKREAKTGGGGTSLITTKDNIAVKGGLRTIYEKKMGMRT